WAFMWVLAFAIYFSLKWLTWWRARTRIAMRLGVRQPTFWLGREWTQSLSWMRVSAYRRRYPQLGCGRSSKQFSVQFCSGLWRNRWNLGFRQLAHELIFRPLHRTLGGGAAGFLVFVASGLIHDLVISLPAHAGYGLPTAYFVLQGVGMTIEHSSFGKRLGL